MASSVKIILGSQSPRRLEILSHAGYEVEVVKPLVEEVFPDSMDIYQVPEFLSRLKMDDIAAMIANDNDFIVCADTVVIYNHQLVGKPESLQDAFRCLKMLNGQQHDVVTGVCIRKNGKVISFSEQAKVYFKPLPEEEIQHYVNTCQPLDKAGAYNIQEYAGVDKLEGEFFNVMGLPLQRVQEVIQQWDNLSPASF